MCDARPLVPAAPEAIPIHSLVPDLLPRSSLRPRFRCVTTLTSHGLDRVGRGPAAATDQGAVPAGQQIKARVFLTGQNPSALAAAAQAVSDPDSPQHGRYLTPDQVKAQFGPSAAQVAQVSSWLQGAGLTVSHTTDD